MDVEITYPKRNEQGLRKQFQRYKIIRWAKWPFMFAVYFCPILNITTGGPAWSVIVIWALWIVWSFTLSPDLVEINRISLFVKFLTNAAILLIMIDVLLSPGWAIKVVPIVGFSGLVVAGILLFSDIDRQKQNMMPMLRLIIVSLIGSVSGLIIWSQNESKWAFAVMGAFAFALLVAEIAVLGNDFIREIKRRFHIK